MPSDRHLVVLRGNSATGKTTLARALQLAMGRGTANVGQDHLRRIVLREHDVPDGANITLIRNTVEQCLALGFHTILEGILVTDHYAPMLRELLARHDGPSHVYWLDLPLAETVQRHLARPLAAEVPAEKLHEWFTPGDLLGVDGERVLDCHLTVDGLVAAVLADVGPITPRPDDRGARFL